MSLSQMETFPTQIPRAELDKRGYKWINREIEQLDPYKDYEQIWALTGTYYINDYLLNLIYTLGMTSFTVRPVISELLADITKKVTNKQQKRMTDTNQIFWQWFELGPSHPHVQGSLEVVNQIHMALSKQNPGRFPALDYIYTCCWVGAGYHRLLRSLGLRGFSENQKIAAHLFWKNLCAQFRNDDGPIEDFPNSFEEMLDLLGEFESMPWEQVETGKKLAEAISQQFCDAWFPRGFHWLGRQIVLSLQGDSTRKTMQMGDPNPVMRSLIRNGVWLFVTMQERVLPDPKLSIPEKARARDVRPIQHREPRMIKVQKCPFNPKANGGASGESQ